MKWGCQTGDERAEKREEDTKRNEKRGRKKDDKQQEEEKWNLEKHLEKIRRSRGDKQERGWTEKQMMKSNEKKRKETENKG